MDLSRAAQRAPYARAAIRAITLSAALDTADVRRPTRWKAFLSVLALPLAAAVAFGQEGMTERVSISESGGEGNAGSYTSDVSPDARFVAFQSSASNLVAGDTNGQTDVFVRDRLLGTIERVSVSTSGEQGNDTSRNPAISADGRYVAYYSFATNLVPADTNGTGDVFVRDRTNGTTEMASVSSAEEHGNGFSRYPDISENGQYVVFESDATNLVSGDTNGTDDVFVRDILAGMTYLVSCDYYGGPANGYSSSAAVSADGRYVAFDSIATDIVAGDANGARDVFVRDMQSGTTELVSLSTGGVQGNSHSTMPAISADGQYVVFQSDATNLEGTDTNGLSDIYVRNRLDGITKRASMSKSGSEPNGACYAPDISGDGWLVVFESDASNLFPGDTNGVRDVFVRAWSMGVGTRVSLTWEGTEGNYASTTARTSADGRYVVFDSVATNLVPGDTNAYPDVFLRDIWYGTNLRASVDSLEVEGNDQSAGSSISANGRYVAFPSGATNLVPGDTNGEWDVFVRDTEDGTTERVSVATGGAEADASSSIPAISADGRYVAFHSSATNLVPGDANGVPDVFVHDRWTGETCIVSVTPAGEEGNGWSFSSAINEDGRYVAFRSSATDLVAGDTNGRTDVFVRDMLLGVTSRVSVSSAGAEGNGDSVKPAISADGCFVAFESCADNLVPGDMNGKWDVFAHEMATGITTLVSSSLDGGFPNDDSYSCSVSGDGSAIAFESLATNLVVGDTNSVADVFVRDLGEPICKRVSISSAGEQANTTSSNPSISTDGRYVAFESNASNLVDWDTSTRQDVFVHDRLQAVTTRLSVSYTVGKEGNGDSGAPSISADGRYVAFHSYAYNLVPNDTNRTWDVFVRDRERKYRTISGAFTFGHLAGPLPASVQVRVTWYGWLFGLYDAALQPDGSYALELPEGELVLSAKHTHWLRMTVPVGPAHGEVSGVDFDLINGDANDDNSVDLVDMNQVLTLFGTSDPMTDLDEDGMVSLPDLNIVLVNFGLLGD
jgi:Tol biopolymer transport system component